MERKFNSIIEEFGLKSACFDIGPIGNGLINHTYFITNRLTNEQFILQEINSNVFKYPEKISRNIRLASDYLKIHHPDYLFLNPIQSIHGEEMVSIDGSYWRLLPFIENSIAYDVVDSDEKAYQAAKTFGGLTKRLNGCDIDLFENVLPQFHDLSFRIEQFEIAVKKSEHHRFESAKSLMSNIEHFSFIHSIYKNWITSDEFTQRIQHHDTKLSNVLLDINDSKGLCVIDLDTLMKGFLFSDFGDMMRTYVSPVSEEETDLEKIVVRTEYFEIIARGYLEEMGDIITDQEEENLFNAGLIMIYMQCLRFLTDYLNGDVYYKVNSPWHNYNRALNQFTLLERYFEKQHEFEAILADVMEEIVK